MSHYPILMWNGKHRGVIMLYGHTHITVEDDYFQKCLKKMNENLDLKSEGTGYYKFRAKKLTKKG